MGPQESFNDVYCIPHFFQAYHYCSHPCFYTQKDTIILPQPLFPNITHLGPNTPKWCWSCTRCRFWMSAISPNNSKRLSATLLVVHRTLPTLKILSHLLIYWCLTYSATKCPRVYTTTTRSLIQFHPSQQSTASSSTSLEFYQPTIISKSNWLLLHQSSLKCTNLYNPDAEALPTLCYVTTKVKE